MVFSTSTRDSSESVLSLFVLLTLHGALKNRWDLAAIMLGVSVHRKIYPAIYGIACISALASGGSGLGEFVNWRIVKFGSLRVSTFVLLSGFCYLMRIPSRFLVTLDSHASIVAHKLRAADDAGIALAQEQVDDLGVEVRPARGGRWRQVGGAPLFKFGADQKAPHVDSLRNSVSDNDDTPDAPHTPHPTASLTRSLSCLLFADPLPGAFLNATGLFGVEQWQ
ncbi:MAG: hypothetical protein NXY57DRAFT_1043340 [Lentinula lateritia]|nr:MAG: hypothetical protein NXY57DRAFT_1043340 [Lentinula lateritia]